MILRQWRRSFSWPGRELAHVRCDIGELNIYTFDEVFLRREPR